MSTATPAAATLAPATPALAFGNGERAVFADADGSRVVVTLKGPGSGTVSFPAADPAASGAADPTGLAIEGTTAASALTIKGRTSLGGATVAGPLGKFVAKAVAFTGTLSAAGGVGSVQLGDVTDADLTFGLGGETSLVLGNVFDAAVFAAGPIVSLKVASWTDTSGPVDTVAAPLVARVVAGGDFGGTLVAGSVGTVTVGGTLTGEVRSEGDVGTVTARTLAGASVYAGLPAGFAGLPAAVAEFANPAATLGAITVKGRFVGSFTASYVAAPTIGRAALGVLDASNEEVVFGVAADLIRSAAGNIDGIQPFKLKNLSDPSQSISRGDGTIRVL